MNKKLRTDELGRVTPEQFKEASKTPLVVVLDDVRSMNNVGSVFRTADAFKLEGIRLCGITPRPPHRDIQKTALGATETVAWEYHDTVTDCMEMLKKQGYHIAVVEQAEKTTALHAFQPIGKLAVVLGNEVKGVAQSAIDMADTVLEIPQFGTKHSLNISVCAGIVIWDLFNKLQ